MSRHPRRERARGAAEGELGVLGDDLGALRLAEEHVGAGGTLGLVSLVSLLGLLDGLGGLGGFGGGLLGGLLGGSLLGRHGVWEGFG